LESAIAVAEQHGDSGCIEANIYYYQVFRPVFSPQPPARNVSDALTGRICHRRLKTTMPIAEKDRDRVSARIGTVKAGGRKIRDAVTVEIASNHGKHSRTADLRAGDGVNRRRREIWLRRN
jgi:hypothetical protein